MAIDPRIPLQLQPLNIMDAVMKGQDAARQIRLAPVLERVKAQLAEQKAIQGEQAIAQNDQQLGARRVAAAGKAAEFLRKIPRDERRAALEAVAPTLREFGMSDQDIFSQGLDDVELEAVIETARATGRGGLSRGRSWPGERGGVPGVFTEVFDRSTGGTRVDFTPLGDDSKLTNQIGLTAEGQVTQAAKVRGAQTQAEQDVRLETDPEIAGRVAEATVKGRTKAEREAAAPDRIRAADSRVSQIDGVIDEIDGILDLVGPTTVGFPSQVTRNVEGTDAFAIRTFMDNVFAALSFDRLTQMREESPTGGALGNVIDRLLYGAVADFLNMSCCGIDNPFAFNLADVWIFAGALGLVIFGGSKREA